MTEYRLITTDNDGRSYDQQVSSLEDGVKRALYFLSDGKGWAKIQVFHNNTLTATLSVHTP